MSDPNSGWKIGIIDSMFDKKPDHDEESTGCPFLIVVAFVIGFLVVAFMMNVWGGLLYTAVVAGLIVGYFKLKKRYKKKAKNR
jgi:c-di-AMP phosphodiesterase-like protein